MPLVIILQNNISKAATAVCNCNWSSAATWGGTLPLNGETITIPAGITVTADNTFGIITGNLTVNGTLIVNAVGTADITVNGAIIINAGGVITNNGKLEIALPGYQFVMGPNSTYTHNPLNGGLSDESIFYNGVEDFDPTSNLIIQKWFDEIIPLGDVSRVASTNPGPNLGNFGNVTLNVPGVVWDQDGKFGPWRIKGNFTVLSGQIIMDDGTGASSSLQMQNVTISGPTSSITFQTGPNRPFTFTCNDFTDNSTSATNTFIMNQSFGTLLWNVNGNLTLNHSFTMIAGTMSEGANATLNVSGNVNFQSGTIELAKQILSNFTMTVAGTTTLGNTTKVRFMDGNSGNLVFSTANLVISGGNDNIFLGGNAAIPQASGTPTINITNNFFVTGPSLTYFLYADLNNKKLAITVGKDFISSSTAAEVRAAYSIGAVTFKTIGDFIMNGGNFIGQMIPASTGIDSVIVGQDFTFNSSLAANYCRFNYGAGATVFSITGNYLMNNSGSAVNQGVCAVYGNKLVNGSLTMTVGGTITHNAGRTIGIYEGAGNMTLTATSGVFDMNGGDFRGIHFADSTNAGTTTFSLYGIDFDGGTWMMHYGVNAISSTATLSILNECDVNFTAVSDQFMLIGLPLLAPVSNSLSETFTVGKDLIISGVGGRFVSSQALGTETINITGSVMISGGNNSFNIFQNSGFASSGHTVNLTVNGDLNVSGGNTFLSAEYGLLAATINGNLNINGGSLSLKGGGAFGTHTVNILGGFNQTAGTLILHDNTSFASNIKIFVTVNSNDDATGDFSQTGGTILYDNNGAAGSAEHEIIVKSPNVTVSGTGSITHALPGTCTVFGLLTFAHGTSVTPAVINFTRGGSHNIQQVKQSVEGYCTLSVNSGNVQVASYNSNLTTDLFTVKLNGVLDLKTNQLFTNTVSLPGGTYYSSVLVSLGGRLILQNANGLYDNTALAAINSTGNMNYFLSSGSYVQYNGLANQVLTGIGVGLATLAQHKYGYLEINFQGTPGTNFVYLSTNPLINVFVRTRLFLMQGELNLDNDHVPSNGGGRTLTIESSSTTAITPTSGFIRSEVENGLGIVKWMLNTATGAHVVPFGYNAANLIPVTYSPTVGTTGDVSFATYHTVSANTPYPPTVTHVNAATGGNNSAQTIDRFWYINTSTATPPNPDITFTYMASEIDLASNPRAQKWMFPVTSWGLPIPGSSQSAIVNGVQVINTAVKSGWWALASQSSPLPVNLLDFTAGCINRKMEILWTTASEENNRNFTVEKSKDGHSFQVLTKVDGAGTSTVSHSYKAIDQNPYPGTTFYRLSQTDFNLNTEIFKTISAKSCIPSQSLQMSVAPDEEQGTVLFVTAPVQEQFEIIVIDVTGKKVISSNAVFSEGFNQLKLNTKNLSNGVYMVNLKSLSTNVATKFFVAN